MWAYKLVFIVLLVKSVLCFCVPATPYFHVYVEKIEDPWDEASICLSYCTKCLNG